MHTCVKTRQRCKHCTADSNRPGHVAHFNLKICYFASPKQGRTIFPISFPISSPLETLRRLDCSCNGVVKDVSVCSLGHHMPAPQGGWLALVEQVRLIKMVVVKRARGQLTAHKIRGHIYKMRNNSGNYPCKTHPYKLVVGITRSPHFVVPSIGLFIAHVDARYTAPCLPQLMVGPRF